MSTRGRSTASGSCSAYAAGVGGLPTAVVLDMLVMPALFLRHGVGRPGTTGAAAVPRLEPGLEGVG